VTDVGSQFLYEAIFNDGYHVVISN